MTGSNLVLKKDMHFKEDISVGDISGNYSISCDGDILADDIQVKSIKAKEIYCGQLIADYAEARYLCSSGGRVKIKIAKIRQGYDILDKYPILLYLLLYLLPILCGLMLGIIFSLMRT